MTHATLNVNFVNLQRLCKIRPEVYRKLGKPVSLIGKISDFYMVFTHKLFNLAWNFAEFWPIARNWFHILCMVPSKVLLRIMPSFCSRLRIERIMKCDMIRVPSRVEMMNYELSSWRDSVTLFLSPSV